MKFRTIFTLILTLLIGGCSDNQLEEGTLIVGTSGDNPPFEFYDTSTQQDLKGFDIDLTQLIGAKLGRKVVFKDMDFNSLIPSLLSKRIDIIVAALTHTPERAKRVAFSNPYLTSVPVVVIPVSSKAKDMHSLMGLKIGVQIGTTHEQTLKKLKEKLGSLKIVGMNKLTEMAQEIKTGRIDGLITEMDNGVVLVKKNKDWRYISLDEFKEPYCLAMRKDDPFMVRMNEVLKELQDSGELDKLKLKWFGQNNGA